MTDDSPELQDTQKELINLLPASSTDIAESLSISTSTVRDRVAALRNQVDIEYDPQSNLYYLPEGEEVRRVASKHKSQRTKEANEWATEQEAAILRRLEGKPPLVAREERTKGNESIVIAIGDIHMGDVVEDSHNQVVYDSCICENLFEHFTEKTLNLAKMMESVTDFDHVTLLWTGDMVTNENIYEGQAFDIDSMIADQLSRAVDIMVQQAKTYAEYFPSVSIVAVPGNHGITRASGVSKQANMDLLAYRWVQDRLIEAGYTNIDFNVSEATHFRNFEVRGWRGHLRHGHNSKIHVDATSSSQSEWRGWQNKHVFDFAVRGHVHTSRREDIMNEYSVFTAPSMKPGSDFAEKIGLPDVSSRRKLGIMFGVSDQRPYTWEYVVDDSDYNY